ncbi:hypothetical protein GYMLUDRAFT_469283 [Collybiopsis luxurians FD-317 M1]|uniref:Uncharacterized protein n=1 Tax=Collybiopsis luxurians FD-317 M1 TaxID=944289 RepID=A0A0D0BY32_9AGAR|nr:hypothetical protein GYMLUDRAFT_469283 [Collybiopsis luxurians FD-317 M1]
MSLIAIASCWVSRSQLLLRKLHLSIATTPVDTAIIHRSPQSHLFTFMLPCSKKFVLYERTFNTFCRHK